MAVYLVRHAKAVEGPVDAERPLSPEGQAAAEEMGRRLAAASVKVDRIYHSGLVRARQTAEALAKPLGLGEGLEELAGLLSGDPPARVASWLEERPPGRDVMLVSHMPLIGGLASLLVAGDAEPDLLRFRTGTVAKLVRRDDTRRVEAGYLVDWVASPRGL